MKQKQSWEIEFDEEFLQFDHCGNRECEYDEKCFHASENEIKTFIKELLSAQREEFSKIVSQMIGEPIELENGREINPNGFGYNKKRYEILKIAKDNNLEPKRRI